MALSKDEKEEETGSSGGGDITSVISIRVEHSRKDAELQ